MATTTEDKAQPTDHQGGKLDNVPSPSDLQDGLSYLAGAAVM
jgi:hypothetical protein